MGEFRGATPPGSSPAGARPAAGLASGQRYRCGGCGNLTRFDIETVERVRRFWHADLSGQGVVEETEALQVDVVAVTCRWCGASDRIEVVDAPSASSAS